MEECVHLRAEVVTKGGESLLQLPLVYRPWLVPGMNISCLSIDIRYSFLMDSHANLWYTFKAHIRCFPTCQKPWSSFANRPHIAREPQTLCSKSHQTCLCQTDLEVVLVIFLLKQFAMSYLSCCWWWPCWTLCRCHWPRPFATLQGWLSQICSRQLCGNLSLGMCNGLMMSKISYRSK